MCPKCQDSRGGKQHSLGFDCFRHELPASSRSRSFAWSDCFHQLTPKFLCKLASPMCTSFKQKKQGERPQSCWCSVGNDLPGFGKGDALKEAFCGAFQLVPCLSNQQASGTIQWNHRGWICPGAFQLIPCLWNYRPQVQMRLSQAADPEPDPDLVPGVANHVLTQRLGVPQTKRFPRATRLVEFKGTPPKKERNKESWRSGAK